ncbi:TPA: hypothetical protein ACHBEH_000941 [Enterococcus faecium]|nr:hypothetical protein [Enterococcus faecium]
MDKHIAKFVRNDEDRIGDIESFHKDLSNKKLPKNADYMLGGT